MAVGFDTTGFAPVGFPQAQTHPQAGALPTIASGALLFAPTVTGGGATPLDPPIVTRWRESPRGRRMPLFGFELYGVATGAGTVPAGSRATVLVPIPGLTSRQAWFVGANGGLAAGIYLRNAWCPEPGTLALVYVNHTGANVLQPLHDVTVLVSARNLPLT